MSVDKTLKALGLRKKTPADKVREAGANLNARFAKLRGATPESRAHAAGARYGLDHGNGAPSGPNYLLFSGADRLLEASRGRSGSG